MKFGPVPLTQAMGKTLAHNISDAEGRRRLRKGVLLGKTEIETLASLGLSTVFVAELDAGDVPEDQAARRVAEAVAGPGLQMRGAATGRTNVVAEGAGMIRIDVGRLYSLNELPGVTLATIRDRSITEPRQLVASVKIIPYALPEAVVFQAEGLGHVGDPIIQLLEFPRRRVGLILMGDAAVRPRLQGDFEAPIRERVERIGSDLVEVDFVPVGEEDGPTGISSALRSQVEAGCEMIILAGQTAIMDEDDIVPRAVVAAGGVVESIGAPVDPGNLLMLAYINGIPVVGAPGCARSRKENVVDWILPRLAIGERIRREDIIELGHGGLLEDFPERSVPRMEAGGHGA